MSNNNPQFSMTKAEILAGMKEQNLQIGLFLRDTKRFSWELRQVRGIWKETQGEDVLRFTRINALLNARSRVWRIMFETWLEGQRNRKPAVQVARTAVSSQ